MNATATDIWSDAWGIVGVWEWNSHFIPQFIGHVITYPFWDYSETMVAKGWPWPTVSYSQAIFILSSTNKYTCKPRISHTFVYI